MKDWSVLICCERHLHIVGLDMKLGLIGLRVRFFVDVLFNKKQ